jgi:arsenate reductase
MAEAWLNEICGDQFEAQSAGLEPGTVNPLAVEVMAEVGIDISKKGTQRVFDVWKLGPVLTHVVTVCDESSAEKCPVFPDSTRRLHWSFPDPSPVSGTNAEKLAAVRKIRDEIRVRIEM